MSTQQKKFKSKWFRVAVAGDTTDGREISADWIIQMAQSYNPQTYGARINVEHYRSAMPDGMFGAYGDVLALKTEKVSINGEQKDALFAEIQPNDNLITLNQRNQKIYTSIEVDPNFAKTGQAYLIGLAVTDSPASLGTEMLQFAAGAQVNPFTDKKQRPENLFTAAQEVQFEFVEVSDKPSLLDKIKQMFSKQDQQHAENFSQNETAILEIAGQTAAQGQEVDALKDKFSALETEFNEMKNQLDQEPQNPQRPKSTNSTFNQDTDVVDC